MKKSLKKQFILISVCFLCQSIWSFQGSANPDQPEFANYVETGIVLDTLDNKIVLCYDKNENPLFFFSEVFTPVCLSSECLPIRINLFWTLAGSYLKYTLTNGEILTKVDHIHFTNDDYYKLDLILRNKISTLNYLKKEDFPFVNPNDSTQKVDGITGATKRVSKRDYVEGAIYTSLTLYHLVNGDVVQKMKKFMLNKIIKSENINFFLEHSDRETANLGFTYLQLNYTDEELLPIVYKMMHSSSSQIVDLAVCYIPESAVEIDSIEIKMCEIYTSDFTSLTTRTKLLELWTGKKVSLLTQEALAKSLLIQQETFKPVLTILENQVSWSVPIYEFLCDAILNENNLSRKEKIYRVIIQRERTFPKGIKKKVTELEKLNGWN